MAEHCLGVPSLRRLLFFFIIIIISIKKLLKGAGMSRCVVYNVNLHRVVPGRLDKFMPKSWGMMLQDPNYPIEQKCGGKMFRHQIGGFRCFQTSHLTLWGPHGIIAKLVMGEKWERRKKNEG